MKTAYTIKKNQNQTICLDEEPWGGDEQGNGNGTVGAAWKPREQRRKSAWISAADLGQGVTEGSKTQPVSVFRVCANMSQGSCLLFFLLGSEMLFSS